MGIEEGEEEVCRKSSGARGGMCCLDQYMEAGATPCVALSSHLDVADMLYSILQHLVLAQVTCSSPNGAVGLCTKRALLLGWTVA